MGVSSFFCCFVPIHRRGGSVPEKYPRKKYSGRTFFQKKSFFDPATLVFVQKTDYFLPGTEKAVIFSDRFNIHPVPSGCRDHQTRHIGCIFFPDRRQFKTLSGIIKVKFIDKVAAAGFAFDFFKVGGKLRSCSVEGKRNSIIPAVPRHHKVHK